MLAELPRFCALLAFLLCLPQQLAAEIYRGPTQNANYIVVLQEPADGVRLNEVQSWTVTLFDNQENPVTPRSLVFLGGMPGHGHGLSSLPRVTKQLSPGRYLVDGVLFNMYGDWEIVIGVVGNDGPDKATIPFSFVPPEADVTASDQWNAQQLALMRSLMLDSAGGAPTDASNRFDGRPVATSLGEQLFNDPKLSRDANIACATCHRPEIAFTDALQTSMGSKKLSRNSPSVQGLAWAKWFYWDGRRDSLWAQALTPIETPGEMDNNRAAVVSYVLSNDNYRAALETLKVEISLADELPRTAGPYGDEDAKLAWSRLKPTERAQINGLFAVIGKTIASYVASLEPSPSRFDRYVERVLNGENVEGYLSASEIRGLELFIDPSKTHCMRCHNGPYLSSFGFHNIGSGVNPESGSRDFGRLFGLKSARVDEFNCIGNYSDLGADACRDLNYATEGHADDGAFKVPGLRNVAMTAPYFHDGRFESLMQLLEFYRSPPDPRISGSELLALDLSDDEMQDIAAFLDSLTGEDGRAPP